MSDLTTEQVPDEINPFRERAIRLMAAVAWVHVEEIAPGVWRAYRGEGVMDTPSERYVVLWERRYDSEIEATQAACDTALGYERGY